MKSTRNHELAIRITTPQGSGYVRIVVQDSGTGIPRESLYTIFEPFVSRNKQAGFGLGLFIVRRIIEQHKGVIYAESEPGRYTRFIIELPANTNQGAAA